jgi:hypothetical protein
VTNLKKRQKAVFEAVPEVVAKEILAKFATLVAPDDRLGFILLSL